MFTKNYQIVKLFFIICLFFTLTPTISNAQGYIAASTYLGGTANEKFSKMVEVSGESYILGVTSSTDFPKTIGSASGGGDDFTLTKLDANGNKIWSRYIGGFNPEIGGDIVVSNGAVFIAGMTYSFDYPVTDGSTTPHSGTKMVYSKFDATTGALQFSTYLGPTYGASLPQIKIVAGYAYIYGDLDINNDGSNVVLYLAKYDINSNVQIFQKTWGGNGLSIQSLTANYNSNIFQVVGNDIFCVGLTMNSNFPVTNASTMNSSLSYVYTKLNATTGAIQFATFFGANSTETNTSIVDLQVDNTGVYMYGTTDGSGFPVTDGSIINKTGSVGLNDYFLIKYNATTNAKEYGKYIGGSDFENNGAMQVQNGIVYLTGSTKSTNFPVTTGSAATVGTSDIYYMKLNATTGAITYSTLLAGSGAEESNSMQVVNGEAYIGASGDAANSTYPVTNGSTHPAATKDFIFTKIGADNKICYSTFIGGAQADVEGNIVVDGYNVYIQGLSSSNDYPVTNNILYKGNNDFVWTRLNLNPTLTPNADITSPATQTICKSALATTLTDPDVTFTGTSFPNLIRNSISSVQNPIVIDYQWQRADAAAGPWTDIPGAVQSSYTPQISATSKYYRRLAKSSQCSSSTILSTSTVAAVLVNANTAPTVNAGSVINTCAGTAVTLGGAPTATGGTAPYTYAWSPAGTAVPNPTVTPTANTIYTVTVTDNNGCVQIAQNLVNAYVADAGPDVSTCANKIVRIGTPQIAGLTGVTYAWVASPADATMSCTTCAQPDVHPTVATTYTLTLTIPITGGGTCTKTDAVVVTPVAGPTTSFGAPDLTICSGSTGNLGNAAETGFTYTWAPGNFLISNQGTPTTFQPGNLSMPNPNPYTYYLTAVKNGCTFVDTVKAFLLKADAGLDGCGPRTVGIPNPTPSIPAIYSWTKISGNGSIIGRTDSSLINVSATTSGVTVYRVSVTYNGVTCTDDVNVPICGCTPPLISVNAPNSCASYSVNGGNVILTATSTLGGTTFAWSVVSGPAGGLNTFTGSTVSLTDNSARTFRVTATGPDGTSCFSDIVVNSPAMSLPTFTATDVTVCPGVATNIGQATVAGYSYLWGGPIANLNSSTISNPSATVNSTTNFPVIVTDGASGCTKRDTATVTIVGFPPNVAGDDITLCGSSTAVQLGVAPVAGITYLWTPVASYAPSNTSANPTVPVSTTTTFHLVATNTATGCTTNDDIVVTVNPAVAPFTFSPVSYCPSTAGAITLPAGPAGMSSYSWTPSSFVLNPTSNGPTATTLTTRPQAATTYTLTVTNASGCTGAADVVFTPSATLPIAGIDKSICKGSIYQLGSIPAESGATYAWTCVPASGTGFLSSASSSYPTFTPTAAGIYTFTVSKTNAGCTTTANVTINVADFTMPALTSPTVCQNSCIQIGFDPATAASGASYSWSPSTGLSDAAITNPLACVTTTNQTYTLTGVGANGCVAKQSLIVGVNPLPAPTVTVPALTACLGSAGSSFAPVVTPAGTYNYIWGPNSGTLSSIYVQNPGVSAAVLGTNSYTLNVTNTITGCATSTTANVTVNNCSFLPVKLVSFTAAPFGNFVNLNWIISNQINVNHYEVMNSIDGVNFASFASTNAINKSNYTLLHITPIVGVNYYRLKIVDNDGKISYSNITRVTMTELGVVTVYPNPANGYVNIFMSAKMTNKPTTITIISMDGRIILQKRYSTLSQTENIDVSRISSGKYYVRIDTQNEVITKALNIVK